MKSSKTHNDLFGEKQKNQLVIHINTYQWNISMKKNTLIRSSYLQIMCERNFMGLKGNMAVWLRYRL